MSESTKYENVKNTYESTVYVIQEIPGTKIGNRVFLGPNASLTNDNTPLRTEYNPEPITVENDVTIGSNSTIMPGITIGEGAFVAGGAIVTKDVPAWHLAKGCPAIFSKLPDNLKKPNRLGS